MDAGALTVLDEHGTSHRLATLWQQRPAVLALVRHFGCLFCRQQVSELAARADEIRAAGAELHVIGNGTPNFMAGFREESGYRGPLYTDPTLRVYDALGMKRGLGTVLRPGMLASAWRAKREGFSQGKVQGAALQQGGVLVVETDGRIRWRHVSAYAGDHPAVADVIAALRVAA